MNVIDRALKVLALIRHPETPEGERASAEAALERLLATAGMARAALDAEFDRRTLQEKQRLRQRTQPPTPPPPLRWPRVVVIGGPGIRVQFSGNLGGFTFYSNGPATFATGPTSNTYFTGW